MPFASNNPLSEVAVCSAESLLVTLTVAPGDTVNGVGSKAKPLMVSAVPAAAVVVAPPLGGVITLLSVLLPPQPARATEAVRARSISGMRVERDTTTSERGRVVPV